MEMCPSLRTMIPWIKEVNNGIADETEIDLWREEISLQRVSLP